MCRISGTIISDSLYFRKREIKWLHLIFRDDLPYTISTVAPDCCPILSILDVIHLMSSALTDITDAHFHHPGGICMPPGWTLYSSLIYNLLILYNPEFCLQLRVQSRITSLGSISWGRMEKYI